MNNLRFITICLPTSISRNIVKLCPRLVSFHCLHTSSIHLRNSEAIPIEQRVYKKPVDWLPFKWHRRNRFNIFTKSGDTIFENMPDLNLPKPDFELSDELKSASPEVKQLFSLITGNKADRKEVCKRQILKRVQRHPNDIDSLEVKIALKTITVRALFEHNRDSHKREIYISRVVLPILIQKRNKLLKELRNIDEERFNWLIDELKLYYIAPPLNPKPEMYCKKWDLRRLTKEYCENQIEAKKAAYHEELKKEQESFLEEKKQTLAWIAEEEEAIKALSLKLNC